jgi:peroxiredoxin
VRYLVTILLLALAAAVWLYVTPKQMKRGEIVTPFVLNTMKGRAVDYEKLAGKTKCILFFSVDDEESRQMFSEFRFITEHFKSRGDVRFLAIAVNGTRERVPIFMSPYQFPGDVLLDEDGSVARSFRVGGLPALFVVNGGDEVTLSMKGWKRDDIREIIPAIRMAAK